MKDSSQHDFCKKSHNSSHFQFINLKHQVDSQSNTPIEGTNERDPYGTIKNLPDVFITRHEVSNKSQAKFQL
jgi:hypothetical protein